jgi:hypothetical protein
MSTRTDTLDADLILARYHARHAVRSLVCPVCMGTSRRRPGARVRRR